MKYLTMVGLLFLSLGVTALEQLNLTKGKSYSVNSKYLKEGQRNYYINLPKNYESSKQSYPVLYILDGQMHFTSAVAIRDSLGNSTEIPEMIIVGVENTYPRRRDMKWGEREAFVSFISEELVPLIDKEYRTKEERIIFGWEWGSYFASLILMNDRQLFDGAISSNGGHVDQPMISRFKSSGNSKKRYLYLANSIQDIFSIDNTNQSAKVLDENPAQQLIWKKELFNNETHSSLPYLAMYHGLRFFYHNYDQYEFYSIKQYEEFGGIPAIKKYFKARAERFGFPDKIDNSTKDKLIWLSWKRDNFDYFDFFMKEFVDVLQTKRYQSEYWQNRLGQYYLKYQKYDQALPFFQKSLKDYEPTARIYNGLGLSYLGNKKKAEAVKYLKMAVEKATADSDEKLESYLSDLKHAQQG